jgi:MoaA/NifB/PqqE/SkfB family radical SAM enzyme
MSSEFSAREREQFLQINVTSRCNLRCTHCYVDDADAADMPLTLFSRAIQQFDELAAQLNARKTWVQISGGEPLVHPRIAEMLEISASRFPTKILTNGILIDSENAKIIAKYCQSAQISFDGDTRESHDQRRGQGAFDAALAGLRQLKEHGVSVSARITIGSDNSACALPLFERIRDEIDVFHVSRVVPIGSCSADLPDRDAYRKIVYRLFGERSFSSKVGLRDPFFGPLLFAREPHKSFGGCSAGFSGMCVDQAGTVFACRRLPISLGNISGDTLADLFVSSPLLQKLRKRELTGACGVCDEKSRCGGSRCVAYAVSGDPFAEDPGCIFQGSS